MEIPVSKAIATVPVAAAPAERKPAGVVVVDHPQAPTPVAQVEAIPATRIVQTQEAIAELVSRYLQTSARNLEFQVEGDSATPVIIVRDGQGNVVRRIPGDAALQMLRLANAQSGTFVDSSA